ncbi:hypothetical protein SAMN02799624_01053 [Paenibacillus sp. UNC496MF]|uniref:hypothetical protein n=1 Tax=Paenibacillus sp. UNC496MF TaxID=1502753 RepID=UPI0008E01DC8|nr:hypothetical protein [Paenibacillus sp. UNC496MF]SFI49732.1 hypothetical protein SAMN02799624_01053 [Paenibacillus sp. UNC496MF]
MLTYQFDDKRIRMQESPNGDDIEFRIELLDDAETLVPRLKAVRAYFEDNDVLTDVLFYAYPNHVYAAIVRPDYYADFVLQLMKHRLLRSVAWTES